MGKTATTTPPAPDSTRNTDPWALLEPSLALLSLNTRKAYGGTIRSFREYLDGQEVTPELGRAFILGLVTRGLKSSSMERYRAALRWLFVEVLDQQLPRFPKMAHQESEPRYLRQEETQALLAACGSTLEKAVVYTLYGVGLRVSALLGLTREDLDPEGYLRIWGKGGKQEWVPAPEEALEALAAQLGEKRGSQVFRFGYSRLRSILNQLADRAGIKRFNPHALRHSYVTHSLMSGASVQDVSRAVRHRNIQTTMRYTHIAARDLKGRLPNLLAAKP